MSLVLATLLGLVAWATLSLGLPKHFRALRARDPSLGERKFLRAIGWSTLVAMCAVCIAAHGWEFGSVYAVVLMMLTALAWALWMTRMTQARAKR
jgi:hypothetical protein